MPFELEARLETKRDVEIEWCDIRITGYELTNVRGGVAPVMTPRVARLTEARTLHAGVTSLPVRAEIPAGETSPTFVGLTARTVYEAHVHASVPWWPDARASFVLNVVLPRGAPAQGSPRVTSSRAGGPSDGRPYLEVSVASDLVEPGGVVEGALSIRGARGARFATVAVVVFETLTGHTATRGSAYEVRVDIADVPDGASVPFALRLPADVTPGFVGRTFRVQHWLEVVVRGSFQALASTSLPLGITPSGSVVRTARLIAPHVGDARLTALFEGIARDRGHAMEPGPTLVVHRNQLEARIERALGPDGTHLVLTAAFPSLQLGLHAHDGGLVERLFRGSVTTGEATFDAGHVVHGREREQVTRAMRALAPLLADLAGLRMTDESLTASARTHANDRASIERVVERAEAILDALVVPPPMPAVFDDVIEEWRELARWLDAPLERGHARIGATHASSRVEIVTHFEEDQPSSTSIEVRPEVPTTMDIDVRGPEDVLALRGLPPEALTLLDRLARAGAVEVRAHGTRITIGSPLVGASSPKIVRPLIETIVRLHETLKPTRGPFR